MRWPDVCEKGGCEDPHLQPHHHHEIQGYLTKRACQCNAEGSPGTRPKDKKKEKK